MGGDTFKFVQIGVGVLLIAVGIITLNPGLVLAGATLIAGAVFAPEVAEFAAQERELMRLIRSPNQPKRIIYGEKLISGAIAFGDTRGQDNEELHLIVPLTEGQILGASKEVADENFYDLYLNDDRINRFQRDFEGEVVSGFYDGFCTTRVIRGFDDQPAVQELINAFPGLWSTAHQLNRISYAWIKLKWDRDKFATGIPNIRWQIKGRCVWDPRDTGEFVISLVGDGTTEYTANTKLPHGLGDKSSIVTWSFTKGTTFGSQSPKSIGGPSAFNVGQSSGDTELAGWDLAAFTFTGHFKDTDEFVNNPLDASISAESVTFHPGGRKIFFTGGSFPYHVIAGDLEIPWDISTLTLTGTSTPFPSEKFVFGSKEYHTDLVWRPDGLEFWALDGDYEDVSNFLVGEAWNLNTAQQGGQLKNFFALTGDPFPTDIGWSLDGTRFYLGGGISNKIFMFSASAFNVNTVALLGSLDVESEDTVMTGFKFRDDGLKMFMLGRVNKKVFSYTLGTAWDVTSAVLDVDDDMVAITLDVSNEEQTPLGLHVDAAGLRLHITGAVSDPGSPAPASTRNVWEYEIGTADQSGDGGGLDPLWDCTRLFVKCEDAAEDISQFNNTATFGTQAAETTDNFACPPCSIEFSPSGSVDPSQAFVSYPDIAAYDVAGEDQTVEFFFRHKSLPDPSTGSASDQTYASQWTTSGDQRGWRLFYDNAGFITYEFSTDGTAGAINTLQWAVGLVIDRWYKLRLTRSGDDWNLELNVTTLASQITQAGSVHDSTGLFYIGKIRDAGGDDLPIDGFVQHLRFSVGCVRTDPITCDLPFNSGRFSICKFTQNPVLHALDFLIEPEWGLGATLDELDLDQIRAAANVCEEQVALTQRTDGFTVGNAGQNAMVRTGGGFQINTGAVVRVSGGSLPSGLTDGTEYFYQIQGSKKGFGLATTYQNALDGILVNIGDGQGTIRYISQPRYTSNGAVILDKRPIDILTRMMTACAGGITYVGGKFRINVGTPGVSVGTITDDDMRDEMEVVTDFPRKEAFNRVAGIFTSPKNFWQPTDFVPLKNKAYAAEDGRQFTKDIELPFTTDETEAQRLAKIFLETSRQGLVARIAGKLSTMRYRPWDVLNITNLALGWNAKQFRCRQWSFGQGQEGVGMDLECQSDSDTVFNWTPGDEKILGPAPLTNAGGQEGSGGSAVANITGMTLEDSPEVLSGSVVNNRILVSWDQIGENHLYEIHHKKSSDTDWIVDGITLNIAVAFGLFITRWFIEFLNAGTSYDVRVRALEIGSGRQGPFNTIENFVVAGDVTKPPDVTSITLNGSTIFWDYPSPPADLKGFNVRQNPGSNTFWANADLLTPVPITQTQFVISNLTPGDHTVMVKAVDLSGNESLNAAVLGINIPDPSTGSAITVIVLVP